MPPFRLFLTPCRGKGSWARSVLVLKCMGGGEVLQCNILRGPQRGSRDTLGSSGAPTCRLFFFKELWGRSGWSRYPKGCLNGSVAAASAVAVDAAAPETASLVISVRAAAAAAAVASAAKKLVLLLLPWLRLSSSNCYCDFPCYDLCWCWRCCCRCKIENPWRIRAVA